MHPNTQEHDRKVEKFVWKWSHSAGLQYPERWNMFFWLSTLAFYFSYPVLKTRLCCVKNMKKKFIHEKLPWDRRKRSHIHLNKIIKNILWILQERFYSNMTNLSLVSQPVSGAFFYHFIVKAKLGSCIVPFFEIQLKQ